MDVVRNTADNHEFLGFVFHDSGDELIQIRSPGFGNKIGSSFNSKDNVGVQLRVCMCHITDIRSIGGVRFCALLSCKK
jgi:hypothetical protein